jgi:SAM-dependent methyltransferase
MGRETAKSSRPLVTSGTASWQRDGAAVEHELLSEFLEDTAATETIQSGIAIAVSRMNLQPGFRVLDVGCGTGVIFAELAEAVGSSGSITGLDHAEGFLADARTRADADGYGDIVELIRGDAHRLPFPDAWFDAAHTERVLMHLDNPTAAIRELRRVVKPGGWVVCVEPDLTGMRIDLPAAENVAKVLAGFCVSIMNPSMGLELNRRMATAGLIERQIDTMTEVVREYDEAMDQFFVRAAATAVDRGWLTDHSATETLAAMRQAGLEGIYTSYSSMFIVAGRVP